MKSYIWSLAILAVLVVIPLSQAEKATTFKLEVKGDKNSIEYYQTKAQWQLMKGDKTCRGFYLPRPKSKWKCTDNNNQKNCVREFECSLSNKSYNRKNEINRLASELKKFKSHSGTAKAVVKTQSTKLIADNKPAPKKKEIVEVTKSSVQKTDKKLAVQQQRNEIERFETFSEQEDLKQMQTIKMEPKYVVEEKRSLDGRTAIFNIRPKEEDENVDGARSPFLPMAFSGAMTKVSDQNTNSLSTTDIAWTPRYRFKNNWGLKGNVGGHYIKSNVGDVADESETFLVMDFSLVAEYFLTENLYFDFGMGIQKWNSTTGGAFSTMSFGGGYQFDFHKIKLIDRIFANYNSVGNEDKNKELKIGIGISF